MSQPQAVRSLVIAANRKRRTLNLVVNLQAARQSLGQCSFASANIADKFERLAAMQ